MGDPTRRSQECERSHERGQTEPLAALVAVAAVCAAISLYTGVTATVFSQAESDRSVGEATIQSTWAALSEDGLFETDRTRIADAIDTASLPDGRYVHVNVTFVADDGSLGTAGGATFGPDGTLRTSSSAGTAIEVPGTATRTSRPIPVRIDNGDVRPGRLTVVVWE